MTTTVAGGVHGGGSSSERYDGRQRTRLQLKARSKEAGGADDNWTRSSSIFGDARPRDQREIEKKFAAERRRRDTGDRYGQRGTNAGGRGHTQATRMQGQESRGSGPSVQAKKAQRQRMQPQEVKPKTTGVVKDRGNSFSVLGFDSSDSSSSSSDEDDDDDKAED